MVLFLSKPAHLFRRRKGLDYIGHNRDFSNSVRCAKGGVQKRVRVQELRYP